MRKHLHPDTGAFAKKLMLLASAILLFSLNNMLNAQCGLSSYQQGSTLTPTTSFQTVNAGGGTYVDFNVTQGKIYSFYYGSGTASNGYIWDMTLSSSSTTLAYNNSTTPLRDSWTGGSSCANQTRPGSAEWYATYTGTVRVNVHSYSGSTCYSYVSGQNSSVVYYKVCPTSADPGDGSNNWNVDAYATTDLSIPNSDARYGYYTDNISGLRFKSTNYWASNSTPASATGWSGCATIEPENFVVRARRKGFTCGAYKVQINSADDLVKIYINGTAIYTSSSTISSATIVGNTNGYVLGTNDEVEIRFNGLCSTNQVDVQLVAVTPSTLSGGAIAANQTICTGSTPAALTNTTSASGGYNTTYGNGSLTYEWFAQPGCTGGATDLNTHTSTYSPGNLTTTTCYYRKVTDGCGNVDYANVVTITVNQPSTAPGSISATSGTICNGGSTTLSVNGGSLGTGASWHWYSGGCGTTSVGTGSSISVSPTTTTTYFVRAEDPSPCSSNTTCASITITVNNPSTAPTGISATSTSICSGNSTTLTVQGGSLGTGSSWHWYSGSCGGTSVGTGSSISVTPTSTTTYFVRAEDPSPCSSNTICASVTITVSQASTAPTGINATASTICNGNSTTLTVQGGSLGTGASWKWYTGTCGGTPVGTGASITVSPLTTTTYFVRAEDPSPCSTITACATATITVNQPSTAPTGASATATTICNGSNTTLSVVGGSLGTGATWHWYSGSCGGASVGTGSSISVSPTTTTTYFVRAEDPSPCSSNTICASATITVNQPSSSPSSVTPSPATICNGQNSSLTVNGGSLGTGATWTWYAGGCGIGSSIGTGSTINVSPTTTTDYYVRAEGSAPCPVTTGCASATVTVNQLSTAPTSISGTTAVCIGGNTTLSVVGGSLGTGATWNWYSGSCGGTFVGAGPSVTVSPTTNTTYYVRAEGTCNNTICASATVTVNPLPNGSITGSTSICNGSSTNVTFHFSVGTGPFNISYTDGSNVFTLTGVVDGQTASVTPGSTGSFIYSYTSITDANGCVRTSGFGSGATVIVTPLPVIGSAVPTAVLCNGGNTGTITISASSGTPPYYYSIDGGSTYQTSNVFTGLTIGSYNVVVKDTQNCTRNYVSNPVVVTQPAALAQIDSVVNASCANVYDGKITIAASGGIRPYHYSLNGGPSQLGNQFTGLSAGTYTVEVIDSNNCTNDSIVTISNSYIIGDSIQSQTNVSCYGGADGSVTVALYGGTPPYSYSINGSIFQNSPTFNGLTAGNYVVTLRDFRGCTDFLSITITQPNQLSIHVDTVINVLCNGTFTGGINITASGGTPTYTYVWSNGATTQNVSGLASGTYTVTVRDGHSCSTFASATISQPSALFVNVSSYHNLKCYNDSTGSININVTGGVPAYSYLWSNGATTQNLSDIGAANYYVTVTDANGCQKVDSQLITQPVQLSSVIADTNVTCYGGSDGAVYLGVTGGTTPYTYLWGNGATTQNLLNLTAGNYAVVVTDAHGCVTSNAINVTQPPALTAGTTVTNVGCNGSTTGAVTLTVSGGTPGYTYSWSNGATTQSLNGVGIGTYTVTVTDTHGCTATASGTVTQPPALTIGGTATNVTCNGAANGSVALTVTGGVTPYSYAWSNGQTTQNATGLSGGPISVTVTDANTCTITASFTINEPTALVATASGTDVTCHGAANGTATVAVSGGTTPYSYQWSTFQTSQSLSGLSGGTYYVIVTDLNGCHRQDSVVVHEPTAISHSVAITNVLCNGNASGAVNLTVSGGTPTYTFSWSN
ncbi:MAG TPA: SprB repeat-containing protein, partial [Chitinophagales bacterium]|nr:SprB repeat-containing protein [Chitinophagales bacterium]